jgi:hypothetical protein
VAPIRIGVAGVGVSWDPAHKPIRDTLKDVFEPIVFCDLSEER